MYPRSRLSLEGLETRCTPTVMLTANHNLYITGTAGPDTVSLRDRTISGVASVEVTDNGKVTSFPMSQLTGQHVFLIGSPGANSFTNRSSLQVVAYGGPDNDTFYSTSPSFIYGLGGNDVIDCRDANGVCVLYGGDGNDTIWAGSGNDFLYGGAGNDTLIAGPGKDFADGGAGNNTINGGLGADVLYGGGNGDNTIIAGPANDKATNYVYGGTGNNHLYAGGGGDGLFAGGRSGSISWVYGGAGNDRLFAGPGTNYLYGRAGNDYLQGSNGISYLYGEEGNDRLIGGAGSNYLYGGAGADSLYGGAGSNVLDGGIDGARDTIVGGTGRNQIRREFYLAGVVTTTNWDMIYRYDPAKDTLYT